MRHESLLSSVSRSSGRFLLPFAPVLTVALLLSSTGCDSEPEMADSMVEEVEVESMSPPESDDLQEPDLSEGKIAATTGDRDAEQVTPSAVVPTMPESETAPELPSELTIGDPAPPLMLASYVTGQPLESDAGDGVRVVEFWATWCGPCKVSMPHLSELQKEYEGKVDIVGVTDESVAKVENFLAGEAPNGEPWQDVISYRLATDEGRATYAAYMRAAGQSGIPTAFIVGRDGIVEWIGHPSVMDEPLAQVVEGNWDRQAAIKAEEQKKALKQAMQELQLMLAGSNWDEALELLSQLEEQAGKSIDLTRTRLLVLERAGRDEEAAEVRNALIEEAWDDAPLLDALAWNIAMRGREENLPSALRAAKRSVELQDEADASSLDTLARVYYTMGELDKAIAWQTKAAQVNQGTYQQIDQVLEKYQSEKAEQSNAADSAEASSEAERGTVDRDEQSEQTKAAVSEDSGDSASNDQPAEVEEVTDDE